MTNVVVTERLAPELQVCQGCPGGIPDPQSSQGNFYFTPKGKAERVWIEWDVGTIPAGGSAYLMLVMATKPNPKGEQEFTSTGPEMLNFGAVLKYDLGGFKWRETTDGVPINVVVPPP